MMATDVHSPAVRSYNMSRIRGSNTRPELAVRSLLHGMGYRFRLKSSSVPGKPDLVLPRYKVAVFVHGCFWHRHEGCRYATNPKTKNEFWQQKFESNIRRDKHVNELINEIGWHQMVIWECEIKHKENLKRKIISFFNSLK